MILSVIIPVYHVEQTLNRCVESVLNQCISELEVILVDDGSPDKCPIICDEWYRKDSRIKVIHKKNGGLSDARNIGLDIATGDYITFVDSDDYLFPDTYMPLITFLKEHRDVDILEYVIKQSDEERFDLVLEDRVFSSPKDYWLTTKGWQHAYAWNKIYNRRLFNVCRYAKCKIYEDLLLFPSLLKQCHKIATLNHGTYVYTLNQQGISKQTSRKQVYSLLIAELKAAWRMRTMPWNKNALDLYYYICCRIYYLILTSFGIKL